MGTGGEGALLYIHTSQTITIKEERRKVERLEYNHVIVIVEKFSLFLLL